MAKDKVNSLYENTDIDGLVEVLVHDRDWLSRMDAAEALALLNDERGIDYLIASMRDVDSDVSGVAKEILTELNDPKGNQALESLNNTLTRLCPHCGQEHPITTSFCPITGEKLHYLKFCPNCGTSVEPDWRVCGECGTSLQPGIEVHTRQKPAESRSLSVPNWVRWAGVGAIVLFVVTMSIFFYNEYVKNDGNSLLANQDTRIGSADYGAFLVQESQYMALDYIEGGPIVNQYTPTNYSISEYPSLILRHPNLNTSYLELRSETSRGTGPINVNLNPLDAETVEITVFEPLSEGIFCLIQGNPFGSPAGIPHWCFGYIANAINVAGSQPSNLIVTQSVPQPEEPTEQVVIPPSYTPAINTYKKEWTIQTGDLIFFVVDQDGTIYGIGRELLASIGKDGKVLATYPLDLGDCVPYNSPSNDPDMENWIKLTQDDKIITAETTSGEKPCIIKLGDPPILEYLDRTMRLAPYADEGITTSEKPVPEGYSASTSGSGSRGFYFNNFYTSHIPRNSGGASDLYISETENKVGFWSVDGKFVEYEFPESLEILSDVKVDFLITPWNDLYYRYEEYDQLGNKLGYIYIRLRENISPMQINDWPLDFLRQHAISYNPSQQELYALQNNTFMILDKDMNVVENYPLSEEVDIVSSGGSRVKRRHLLGIFVDDNHALYVFDSKESTLSKFSK